MTDYHPASLRYWLPAIRAERIPHPRTRIEPTGQWWWGMLDGIGPPKRTVARFKRIASELTYPVFMRTDFLSGKHNWENTCYLTKPGDLLSHAYALFEEHGMSMGCPDPTALVFREFLNLDSSFLAFHGMPVSCEWRIFAGDGVVECKHFYWPEDALENSYPAPPENWRILHGELKATALPWGCEQWAERVTRRLGGRWSVDVARERNGDWWLIDMAPAAESWHPSHD